MKYNTTLLGQILSISILFSFLLFISCKKGSVENDLAENNTWVFGNTTSKAVNVLFSSYDSTHSTLDCMSTYVNSDTTHTDMYFDITWPDSHTKTGNLLIKDGNSTSPKVTIYLRRYYKDGRYYGTPEPWFNKNTTVYATISKNESGKTTISFPGKIWMYRVYHEEDSLQFSIGKITAY